LLTVTRESSLTGKTTEEASLWNKYHINLLGIGKGKDVVYAPHAATRLYRVVK